MWIMKAIDKIIFNELASRRAIVLPGIGTLEVTRRAAQMVGGDIKAPVNQVVFSPKEARDIPSVALLMRSMGMEPAAAENAYNAWLLEAMRGDDVIINGTGILKQDFFIPSMELEQMLNPAKIPVQRAEHDYPVPPQQCCMPDENRKNTTANSSLTNALIAVMALLLILLVALICRNNDYCEDKRPSDRGWFAKRKMKHVPHQTHCPVKQEVARNNEAEERAVEPIAPSSKRYHLIAGCYLYDSVADDLIARYRRAFPELTIVKLYSGGYWGWIRVSVFQSDDLKEVQNANRRLTYPLGNYEMWVYEKK